ncbi:MAG: hypothetical protein A3D16_05755 [Rhodobacterales bacterium RIFCSPHIGHO2_02_FULL_62_130]|jgi:hypothetical protein|nr:MAG: hypothetical protein A3D16_05755 [Rhodobacterales bacterium RIFCSPHIGHO2_02_FULL_62_130]OHC56761.1 MAG: hypothetical protein A3E48_07465 [Rhodobacterales bacterium RIFCSPHIGHO2_12_FULL_62_75]HCZ00730.1 hypothetical protein [Rhodobacter sp.]
MTKHLADHRTPSQGGRLKHFLRIARDRSEEVWRTAWQRNRETDGGHRRVVEYVRIARGRQV